VDIPPLHGDFNGTRKLQEIMMMNNDREFFFQILTSKAQDMNI